MDIDPRPDIADSTVSLPVIRSNAWPDAMKYITPSLKP
jgi:hypothetical protein